MIRFLLAASVIGVAYPPMGLAGQGDDAPSMAAFRMPNGILVSVADSVDGLIVWMSLDYGRDERGILARFDPVAVRGWVPAVRAALDGAFASSPLLTQDNGDLVVRVAKAGDKQAILAYQPHPDSGMTSE